MDNLAIIFLITTIISIIGMIVLYFRSEKTIQINKKSSDLLNSDQINNSEIKKLNEQLDVKNIEYKNISLQLKEYKETIEAQAKEIHYLSSELSAKKINTNENLIDVAKSEITSSVNEDNYTVLISKLQKEIENLKSDLEDAEDDADKYRSELRKFKSKSESDIEDKQKELIKIQTEYQELQDILAEKEKVLKNKISNIDSANKFLDAKKPSDAKTKDFHNAVDSVSAFVTEDLLPALQTFNEISPKEAREYSELMWQWNNLQKKHWIQKKKVVAFVGEFSAGKTSIVNKLISHGNTDATQLPVSSKATTAIATYIYPTKDQEFYKFTDKDGLLKEINRNVFESVKKDLFSEIKLSKLISHFVIEYKNSNASNITILDTPGFNSGDEEDNQRTANVIRETDVLFWVIDINAGEINQASVNAIKTHLTDLPIYIIANKTDTKSPMEVSAAINKIQDTLNKNNIKYSGIIPFSRENNVSELLDILISVRKKETSNNLEAIVKKLQEEIKEADDTARNSLKLLREKRQKLRNYEETIDTHLQNIIRDIGRIPNLASKQDKWFTADFYKITETDYSVLKSNIENIANAAKNITKTYENMKKDKLAEEIEKSSHIHTNELRQHDDLKALNNKLYFLKRSVDEASTQN